MATNDAVIVTFQNLCMYIHLSISTVFHCSAWCSYIMPTRAYQSVHYKPLPSIGNYQQKLPVLIKLHLITPQHLYSQSVPLPSTQQRIVAVQPQSKPRPSVGNTQWRTLQRTPTMIGGRLASLASEYKKSNSFNIQ